ncbi:hypothetical protein GCM10023185_15620 [Hymenobacter saemangeumensis]|uniref:LysM domain-containing protein n=1 Tax=Hymenobacter saemangeumensis TaxID=1084522 RepID=A0ABP8I9F4_9BACT
MAELKVSDGQSLLDLALTNLGGTEALFALADANGLSITDALTSGQVLTVPDAAVDSELVSYYAQASYRVNTTNNTQEAPAPEPGQGQDYDHTDYNPQDFY